MTLETLKANNARAGHLFFSPDTMRFFRSRISSRIYQAASGAIYIVTSEQAPRSPRRYSVRITTDDGVTFDTVDGPGAYSTSRAAHARAKHLASS